MTLFYFALLWGAALPLLLQADNCQFPCANTQVGDGVCQSECFVRNCAFDAGDCCLQEAPNCTFSKIGDGECDPACNVQACFFDQGDCGSQSRSDCTIESNEACTLDKLRNDRCDEECNIFACAEDTGSCDEPVDNEQAFGLVDGFFDALMVVVGCLVVCGILCVGAIVFIVHKKSKAKRTTPAVGAKFAGATAGPEVEERN